MIIGLLILVFLVSFSGTLLVRKIATKKAIFDIPNYRSSHNQPVPRGGGLAIAFAWYLGIVILFILKQIPSYLFAALLCGIPITIMGFIDDLPVGISFFGRAWSEPLLIEIAYGYEQGTLYRKAPQFLKEE